MKFDMDMIEELFSRTKLNELLHRNEIERKREKQCECIKTIFIVIGVVAAIAGIAYLIYRYFTPDYLEDYEEELLDEEFEDEIVDADPSDEDEEEKKED